MLSGRSPAKLDDKWRFVLPAKFRAAAGTQLFFAKAGEGQLQLLTLRAFESERDMHRLAVSEGRDPHKWAMRAFMESVEQITLDSQARVPVMEKLRSFAGLQDRGELTLIGMDDRIEVWDAASYPVIAAAMIAAAEEAERAGR